MEAREIQYLPPKTLRRHPRNVHVHPKKQIEQLARSIRAFGFTNPILINQRKEVLAGHARLEQPKSTPSLATSSTQKGTPARKFLRFAAKRSAAEVICGISGITASSAAMLGRILICALLWVATMPTWFSLTHLPT